MIWLYDPSLGFLTSFQSFYEVCGYLNRGEAYRRFDGIEGKNCPPWSFATYSHAQLTFLHQHDELEAQEALAYEQGLGCVEVYSGDVSCPQRFVLKEDLNLSAVMRQWCYEYAAYRGYNLFEGFSFPQNSIEQNPVELGSNSQSSQPSLPMIFQRPRASFSEGSAWNKKGQ